MVEIRAKETLHHPISQRLSRPKTALNKNRPSSAGRLGHERSMGPNLQLKIWHRQALDAARVPKVQNRACLDFASRSEIC